MFDAIVKIKFNETHVKDKKQIPVDLDTKPYAMSLISIYCLFVFFSLYNAIADQLQRVDIQVCTFMYSLLKKLKFCWPSLLDMLIWGFLAKSKFILNLINHI